MPKFHVIPGPDSTPVYPGVRKIGPADLKDALAKGYEDFVTMPSSLIFLGLIYPPYRRHRGHCWQAPTFALPAHVGFRSHWPLCRDWIV